MTRHAASFNVPPFEYPAREFSLVWRITKDTKEARCAFWTHPFGAELRVYVGAELVRSEASRDVLALVETSTAWQSQFRGKGWR